MAGHDSTRPVVPNGLAIAPSRSGGKSLYARVHSGASSPPHPARMFVAPISKTIDFGSSFQYASCHVMTWHMGSRSNPAAAMRIQAVAVQRSALVAISCSAELRRAGFSLGFCGIRFAFLGPPPPPANDVMASWTPDERCHAV